MKVTVKRKEAPMEVAITTEFIKLEAAMKLCNATATGGEAKAAIQEGEVSVDGEICTMRGKKLRPGDTFSYQGYTWKIV